MIYRSPKKDDICKYHSGLRWTIVNVGNLNWCPAVWTLLSHGVPVPTRRGQQLQDLPAAHHSPFRGTNLTLAKDRKKTKKWYSVVQIWRFGRLCAWPACSPVMLEQSWLCPREHFWPWLWNKMLQGAIKWDFWIALESLDQQFFVSHKHSHRQNPTKVAEKSTGLPPKHIKEEQLCPQRRGPKHLTRPMDHGRRHGRRHGQRHGQHALRCVPGPALEANYPSERQDPHLAINRKQNGTEKIMAREQYELVNLYKSNDNNSGCKKINQNHKNIYENPP